MRPFIIKATPEIRGRFKLAHLGEDRTVYMPTTLVPMVKALMMMYPTGPIFRTESGSVRLVSVTEENRDRLPQESEASVRDRVRHG
jgi:hypothetical protein